MFEGAGLLRIAYAANILILLPVCWGMFLGSGVAGVFEGKVDESAGLRLLVFVAPLVAAGRSTAVPWGISASFLVIVATYPFLLWKSGALSVS